MYGNSWEGTVQPYFFPRFLKIGYITYLKFLSKTCFLVLHCILNFRILIRNVTKLYFEFHDQGNLAKKFEPIITYKKVLLRVRLLF